MKKIIFLSCLLCFSLGFSAESYAETYYKLPEKTYRETVQYIEDSLLINQQLQNKVTELKQQQKILNQEVLRLQEQIKILKEQQILLENSYKNNEDYLAQENEILKQQLELMKKKNKRLTIQRNLYSIGGVLLIEALISK